MPTLTKSFEDLCDKEFDLIRAAAYQNIDREIAGLKNQFAARGALLSSSMAQAVIDAVLRRYDAVLAAFEQAYLYKWANPEEPLSEADVEWLKAKAFSKLDQEILDVRSRCQSALASPTFAFASFWGEAESSARERRSTIFKKLEILRLRKEQEKPATRAAEVKPAAAAAAPLEQPGVAHIWALLHPTVVKIASSRFQSENFADAVEACLKEINDVVRKLVKDKTGYEYDGSDLMNRAFSLQKPVIPLDDLTTASGRDVQLGYMQIFAGSMTGIRNPKAHANIQIDRARAIHLLFLASLLFFKLDERTS